MTKRFLTTAAALLTAAAPPPPAAPASSDDRAAVAFRKSPAFAGIKRTLDGDYDRLVTELIALTQIPAPSLEETARARQFGRLLEASGIRQVTTDSAGNVLGLRKGRGKGLIVVAAHLDTVFDQQTDVTVRRDGDVLRAPGIADDTIGLAVLLAYVRALDAAGIRTDADILFAGTVGEEQLGNLRGARHLVSAAPYAGRISAFVGFEPARADQLVVTGVGSRRYDLRFTGPGGHSFADFGLVSPAYPLAETIGAMGHMQVPAGTRTSWNVGVISGGTSVNAIPAALRALVDLRSDDPKALATIDQQFKGAVAAAVSHENAARSTRRGPVAAELKPIGDRPAGRTAPDAPIVRKAAAAMRAAGRTPDLDAQSTDANAAMAQGIPAIVIGPGFEAGEGHSPREWLKLNRPHDVDTMATALAAIIAIADQAR